MSPRRLPPGWYINRRGERVKRNGFEMQEKLEARAKALFLDHSPLTLRFNGKLSAAEERLRKQLFKIPE
jgi:hypothetical protein